MYHSDQSEDNDLRNIALLACIMVAEAEGELLYRPDTPCEVPPEAAATVWLLAQARVTLPEAAAYLRGERSVS